MITYKDKKIYTKDIVTINEDIKFKNCEININENLSLKDGVSIKFSKCKINICSTLGKEEFKDNNFNIEFNDCDVKIEENGYISVGNLKLDKIDKEYSNCKFINCNLNINGSIVAYSSCENILFYNCKIKFNNLKQDNLYIWEKSKAMFKLCDITSNFNEKTNIIGTIISNGELHFEECSIKNITDFIKVKSIDNYLINFNTCKFKNNRGYIINVDFDTKDVEQYLYMDKCILEDHYLLNNINESIYTQSIFNLGNCNVNIVNSKFININSTILCSAGQVEEFTLYNCIFEKCGSEQNPIAYVASNNLTIKNNTFNECSLLYIYEYMSDDLNIQCLINECRFYKMNSINKIDCGWDDIVNINKCSSSIFIDNAKNISIQKCIFDECIEDKKTAINIVDSKNISIKESVFLKLNSENECAINIEISDSEYENSVNISDKMKNLDTYKVKDNCNNKSFLIYNDEISEVIEIKDNKIYLKYSNEELKINLNVLVMATMSSGKSTLINSLIGESVLPSKNEACTAKIMTYTVDEKLENINATSYGNSQHVYYNISPDKIENLNEDKSISKIEFKGPIKSTIKIKNNISFIDTPGVNNSQDKSHLDITYKELEKGNFDIIMYVINATQIGIDDDAQLLSKVKSYLKNKKKDIVFVLNKIDMVDDEKEDLDELYKNTITYIKNKVGIKNPKVICTSAYNSNLIKKEIYEKELTRKEKRDLNLYKEYVQESNISYEKYSNITYDIGTENIIDNEAFKLLNSTGIVNIEKYLSKVDTGDKPKKNKNNNKSKCNKSQTNMRNIELMKNYLKNKNIKKI